MSHDTAATPAPVAAPEVAARRRASERLELVQAAIVPQVGALIGAHPGTISLGQGIVGYGPPPGVEKRLASFFAVPANHEYGEVPGTPALIAALAEKLGGENGIDVDANGGDHTLVVTAGSNMAFLNSVLAVADPGDEIVLLRPFYFNHEMAIRIAGCTPVFVDTDARHQPNVSAIEAAITERTRAIVTVSPNNPTGAVYSRDVLLRINEMCGRRGLYHFSDEAYEYFLYGDAEHVSPGAFPGAADHTISFYTLSKSYGFAGWRLGYVVAPAHLADALLKIQDTNVICAATISQDGALAALEAGPEYCRSHLVELAAVREIVLAELDGLDPACRRPFVADGAFYVLIEIDRDTGGLGELSDWDVNARLISEFGVATLPGRAFGNSERCTFRVAYGSLDRATAAEGIGRLVRGLNTILADHRQA